MKHVVICLVLVVGMGCASKTPSNGPASSDNPNSDNAPASSTAPTDATSTDGDSTAEPIVIDVRSESEWDSGHVSQAIHIPHTEITERISDVTTDKDAKIVVYCAVGGRAGKAKAALESLGYTNVENGGGFDDVKDRF